MAVTHTIAVRNALADLIDTTIGASGLLRFHITGSSADSTTAIAATLTLGGTTAFDAAGASGGNAAGVMVSEAITSDTNAAGNAGDVLFASLATSGGTCVVHCAVAASASDINLTGGLQIGAGDTVSVALGGITYTAPL